MSFQIQDIEEINTITQTLLLLSPYNTFTVGDYKMSAYNQDNGYWLLCDGRSLEKISYPELYIMIGTNFGVPVDADHFNLPDFRGRVTGAIGQGNGLTNRTLGNSVGAETHTLTIPQIPSHTHGVTDPGHSHTYVNQPNTVNPAVSLTTTDAADNVNVNQNTGTSSTGISINNTGGGEAHNNMQPTLFGGNIFILSKPLTNSYINYPTNSI
jgi:microcystin-dependent protein